MNPSSLKLRRTGKIFLLLIIICAGQLYGMEPMEEEKAQKATALAIYTSPEMLPELKKEVISTALAFSKDINEVIDTIKKISILHGVKFDELFSLGTLFNLKGFSKLILFFAHKFCDSCFAIACKFNMPVSKKYRDLSCEFNKLLYVNNITALTDVIEQGADIDCLKTSVLYEYMINMKIKGLEPSSAIIKLFLEKGANPNAIRVGKSFRMTALDYLNEHFQNAPEYAQIKESLEKAMQTTRS